MTNKPHNPNNHEHLNIADRKEYLLNQENFERLIYVQKMVEQATEMRPTFKKLINELVTEEALTALTERLIQQMK